MVYRFREKQAISAYYHPTHAIFDVLYELYRMAINRGHNAIPFLYNSMAHQRMDGPCVPIDRTRLAFRVSEINCGDVFAECFSIDGSSNKPPFGFADLDCQAFRRPEYIRNAHG